MTEAEWLACDDPQPMLALMRRKASPRKLRLFACADMRRTYRDYGDQAVVLKMAVRLRLAEAWADGGECPAPTAEELKLCGGKKSALMALHALSRSEWAAASNTAREASRTGVFSCAERRAHQARLLRDLFGNPFRPAVARPEWLTPNVRALARAAYDDRPSFEGTLDPARLSILADALEEAGCSDPELLGHLRSPGPHVRGCWALDLVLGKG
jgi:hypothetical protein